MEKLFIMPITSLLKFQKTNIFAYFVFIYELTLRNINKAVYNANIWVQKMSYIFFETTRSDNFQRKWIWSISRIEFYVSSDANRWWSIWCRCVYSLGMSIGRSVLNFSRRWYGIHLRGNTPPRQRASKLNLSVLIQWENIILFAIFLQLYWVFLQTDFFLYDECSWLVRL